MSNQQFVRNEGLAESVSSPMRTETLQELSADQIVQTILRIQERICQIEMYSGNLEILKICMSEWNKWKNICSPPKKF